MNGLACRQPHSCTAARTVGTRERVQRLAAEMGLNLNPAARALFTGRTGALAMIVPSLTNPYFAPILAGAPSRSSPPGTGTR